MIVTIVVLRAVCAALGWLVLEQRYRLLDTQDVLAAERRLHRNRKKRQERLGPVPPRGEGWAGTPAMCRLAQKHWRVLNPATRSAP